MAEPQPEQPRLLARASQYGYIEINPNDPDAGMHRALHHEPEPLRADQLDDLRYRAQIQRQQTYAAAKGSILAIADQLVEGANAAERRRIRNAIRVVKSL